MTQTIPEKYLKLMIQGICPNCEKPMKIDEVRTHTNQQLDDCQRKFRKKINMPHKDTFVNFKGKNYLVDAKYKPRNEKQV